MAGRLTVMRNLVVAIVLAAGAGCGGVGSSDGPVEYEGTGLVLEDAGHGPELCLGGGVLASDPVQCRGLTLVGWDWEALDWDDEHKGTRTANAHVRGTLDGSRFTVTAPPRPPGRTVVQDFDSFDGSHLCKEPKGDASAGRSGWEESGVTAHPQVVTAWASDPPRPEGNPVVANVIVRPGAAEEVTALLRRNYAGKLCMVERDLPTMHELHEIQERLMDVLGQMVWSGAPNYRRGVVEALVTVADDEARRRVDEAFGPGKVKLIGALTPAS
jgi:hypothetical protein